MTQTFRAISATVGNTVFADIAAPDKKLSVTSNRTNVTRNGIQAPVVRTALVFTAPVSLTEPGCTDNCAPHGLFTESIRIETSAPATSKTQLVADLKMVVSILESHDSIFDGFVPPSSVDIVYTPEV